MERWRWCPKSFHLCSLHLPSKHWKAEKTGQFVWKEATPIDRIFITVMFSCCSRGRVWSSDEWSINVHVLSLLPLSAVTVMMRVRQDEFGRWILSSSVPCSQSTAVYFVTGDFRQYPGFAVRETYEKALSFWEWHFIELSLTRSTLWHWAKQLTCGLKNVQHSPTSSQVTLLTILMFMFICHFGKNGNYMVCSLIMCVKFNYTPCQQMSCRFWVSLPLHQFFPKFQNDSHFFIDSLLCFKPMYCNHCIPLSNFLLVDINNYNHRNTANWEHCKKKKFIVKVGMNVPSASSSRLENIKHPKTDSLKKLPGMKWPKLQRNKMVYSKHDHTPFCATKF